VNFIIIDIPEFYNYFYSPFVYVCFCGSFLLINVFINAAVFSFSISCYFKTVITDFVYLS